MNFLASEPQLRQCKACSPPDAQFLFVGAPFAVLMTAPDVHDPSFRFSAVSHVWGNHPAEHVSCRCGASMIVLASGVTKLVNAVANLSSHQDVPIWYDVMSIDQESTSDIAAQVSIMGHIYSAAIHVEVILDENDFDRFLALSEAMDTLQDSAEDIKKLAAKPARLATRTTSDELIYKMLQIPWLVKSVMDSSYMSRAWTFQEWLLARETTLYCDMRKPLHNFKANMKLLGSVRQALRAVSFEKGIPVRLFAKISAASLLLAKYDDFLTDVSLRDQITLLSEDNSNAGSEDFAVAFDRIAAAFSTTTRQSVNACDQVAAWVSMLSLKFAYDRNDSAEVTLQKVMEAISNKADRSSPLLAVGNSGLGIGKSYFDRMGVNGQFNLLDAAFHFASLCRLRDRVYSTEQQNSVSVQIGNVRQHIADFTISEELPGVLTSHPHNIRGMVRNHTKLEAYMLGNSAAHQLRVNDLHRAATCFNLAMAILSLSGHLQAFDGSPIRIGYRLNTIAQRLYEMGADFSLILLRTEEENWVVLTPYNAGQLPHEVEIVIADHGRHLLQAKSGTYLGWCLTVARVNTDAFVSFPVKNEE